MSLAAREQSRPELLGLTGLRALAAFHVVLFHSTHLLGESTARLPSWLLEFVATGYVAVSFFFVLSGFVLAYASGEAERGPQLEHRRFWAARVARIYPVYLLSFVLDAPRALAYFLQAGEAAKALVAALAYLGMVQSWHPRVASAWNAPGWSLSCEAFFYLLFPGLAALAWRVNRRWLPWLVVAAALVPLLLGAPWVWAVQRGVASSSAYAWLELLPALRLPEFVAGVLLGRLYLSVRAEGRQPRRWLGWLGVALAGVVLLLVPQAPAPLLRGLLVLPFALAIYGLAEARTWEWRWLRHPALVLLGRASFSLYILHQPFKSYVVWGAKWLGLGPGWSLLLLYLAVAVAGSIAVFHWLEESARRQVRAALERRWSARAPSTA